MTELFPAVLLFAASATITPGPNNIMIMTSGLNYGIRASLPHLMGICLGFPIMALLIGLGFGVIFEKFPMLHLMIKWLGITYLIYLAFKIARTKPRTIEANNSKPLSFMQASAFQWVNPKAWIMATSAMATFTSAQGNLYLQSAFIALIFFLVAFPCVGTWLYFGSGLKAILRQPHHQMYFNWVMAGLLLASIVPVVFQLRVSH